VKGISTGAIYELVALDRVLSYEATEVLNFAPGDLVTLPAFLGCGLIVVAGLPLWLGFASVPLISAVLGFRLRAKIMRRIVGCPQFAGHAAGRVPGRLVLADGACD